MRRRRRRRSARRGAAASSSSGDAGALGEQLGDVLDAAVEPVDVGVDLDPVAGRRARAPRRRARWRRRRASSLATPSASSATPLEQRDRGGVVGEADDEDAHRRPPRGSARRAGRPCAARGRRGSAARWRGRPCGRRRRRAPTSTVGAKLRMLRDAGRDQPVADVLGGAGRGGDDADGDAVVARRSARGRRAGGRRARPTSLADARRVGVEQRDDAEAARGEAGVVGQRVPEVADADDDDRPVLGQPELAGDLVDAGSRRRSRRRGCRRSRGRRGPCAAWRS